MDCGPTCLRMIASYYTKSYSIQKLREISSINKDGQPSLLVGQGKKLYSKFKKTFLAGFRYHIGDDRWETSTGLLKGISGIGLVLLKSQGGNL